MSIIKIFKKGKEELTTGIVTYVVEWTSRFGPWKGDTKQRFQAFVNKEEAERFAEEIRRAHTLIGNTCRDETEVTVTTQRSGL